MSVDAVEGYGHYSHDVLVHDNDADLVAAVAVFVEDGLASGGRVLVHSTEQRVAQYQDVLPADPRLTYGFDKDLYLSPSSTLFAYQRQLQQSSEAGELWVAGTVPLGEEPAAQQAWARYESLVNEALGDYAFHALCTYDATVLPPEVIARARATHPSTWTAAGRRPTAAYADPADFLVDELAAVPSAPVGEAVVVQVREPGHLAQARRVLRSAARPARLDGDVLDGIVMATHEVLVNGLVHGCPPVTLEVWAEPGRVTCRVTDRGAGIADTLAGVRHPAADGPKGLWAARQLCEDLFLSNPPDGGCSVLLATG
jgi:anti-sigma regulatory factor (Ser/Thr protein kinase)